MGGFGQELWRIAKELRHSVAGEILVLIAAVLIVSGEGWKILKRVRGWIQTAWRWMRRSEPDGGQSERGGAMRRFWRWVTGAEFAITLQEAVWSQNETIETLKSDLVLAREAHLSEVEELHDGLRDLQLKIDLEQKACREFEGRCARLAQTNKSLCEESARQRKVFEDKLATSEGRVRDEKDARHRCEETYKSLRANIDCYSLHLKDSYATSASLRDEVRAKSDLILNRDAELKLVSASWARKLADAQAAYENSRLEAKSLQEALNFECSRSILLEEKLVGMTGKLAGQAMTKNAAEIHILKIRERLTDLEHLLSAGPDNEI